MECLDDEGSKLQIYISELNLVSCTRFGHFSPIIRSLRKL